jgi:hypothetical protein
MNRPLPTLHCLLVLILFLWGQVVLPQEVDSTTYFNDKLILEQLENHLEFLTSRKLLGRSTLTGHDHLASNYIDSLFHDFNFRTFKTIPQISNYQLLNIVKTTPQQRTLSCLGKTYQYGKDFVCLGPDPPSGKNFEIVFGGFADYNQVDSLNLGGKALLMISSNLRVGGMGVQEQAALKGCSLIIIANPGNPKQFEIVSQQITNQHNSSRFRIAETRITSPSRFFARFNPLPQVIISDNLAKTLLGEKPSSVLEKLSQGGETKQIPSEIKINFDFQYQTDTIRTHNVIAWIPSAKKSQQTVMVCAHVDHLSPDGNTWFPGADDNASGAATLIELARLFAHSCQNGYQPLRNIVFAAFTAEEIGLLGSEYYSLNPLFPLDSTILVLNFDMVGKMGKQQREGKNLFIAGSNKLNHFECLLSRLNNDSTIKIDSKNLEEITLFSLSDHYHFMEKGVPAFLITTGLHNDYHKPTDTFEKISYDNMVNIIKLAFETIKHFADKPNPWEIEQNP